MVRSETAATPFFRVVDLVAASAALLFLAPLMIVTCAARSLVRGPAVEEFLHKSGLADLPKLFDIVAGRNSLIARPPAVGTEAPPLPLLHAAPQTCSQRREIVDAASDREILGRNFRDIFMSTVSAEFDELLRAIDRAQIAWTGRPLAQAVA